MGAVAKICGGEQRPLPVLKRSRAAGLLACCGCIPGLMKGASGSLGPLYPERAVQLLKGPKVHDFRNPEVTERSSPN